MHASLTVIGHLLFASLFASAETAPRPYPAHLSRCYATSIKVFLNGEKTARTLPAKFIFSGQKKYAHALALTSEKGDLVVDFQCGRAMRTQCGLQDDGGGFDIQAAADGRMTVRLPGRLLADSRASVRHPRVDIDKKGAAQTFAMQPLPEGECAKHQAQIRELFEHGDEPDTSEGESTAGPSENTY